MEDGLQKQRKLLIGISLVIICLRAGAVKLTTISIAGNSVTVENPQGFYAIVWIIFAYLFLRYYQYIRQERELGILATFSDKVNDLTNAKLREYVKKKASEGVDVPSLRFMNLDSSPPYFVRNLRLNKPPQGTETININLFHFTPDLVRALMHVLFNTSKFTDYILPFALSGVALLYGSFGPWEGSLLNVLRALF